MENSMVYESISNSDGESGPNDDQDRQGSNLGEPTAVIGVRPAEDNDEMNNCHPSSPYSVISSSDSDREECQEDQPEAGKTSKYIAEVTQEVTDALLLPGSSIETCFDHRTWEIEMRDWLPGRTLEQTLLFNEQIRKAFKLSIEEFVNFLLY